MKIRNTPFIRSYLYTFICCSIILLQGCKDDTIIDEEKMVYVYTDLLIAKDTSSADISDNDSLKNSVLMKYNVSGENYKKTIEYYNEDPERWENFFDKVTSHINKLSGQKQDSTLYKPAK